MTSTDTLERISQVLKLLHAISKDEIGDDVKPVVQKAVKAASNLWDVMKNIHMLNYAERDWNSRVAKATDVVRFTSLLQDDAGATGILMAKKIVSYLYTEEDVDNLLLKNSWNDLYYTIKWVGQLDAALKPLVITELYQKMQSKGSNKLPVVLLLGKHSKDLPDGTDVRTQLEGDCRKYLKQIATEIELKNYDYCLCTVVDDWSEEIAPGLVALFDIISLDSFMLLIQFSQESQRKENINVCCHLMDVLVRSLEEKSMLDSPQALHLWAHAKYIKQHTSLLDKVVKETELVYKQALDKLVKMKANLFKHYINYVTDDNKQKLSQMLELNPHLASIVFELVVWYCNGDLERMAKLLPVARIASKFFNDASILQLLHTQILGLQQTNKFEAFCLYNEFHLLKKLHVVEAPACVRLLLRSSKDHQQLRLVNKMLGGALIVLDNHATFSSIDELNEQLCTATVDQDTALTNFCFKIAEDKCELKLGAPAPGFVTMREKWWIIKPVNEHFVQICNTNSKISLNAKFNSSLSSILYNY